MNESSSTPISRRRHELFDRPVRCPRCQAFLWTMGYRQDGGILFSCPSCGWENRTGTYADGNWATTPNAEKASDI